MIRDYKQLQQVLTEWNDRQQMLDKEAEYLKEGQKKKNILSFRLEERHEENYSGNPEFMDQF